MGETFVSGPDLQTQKSCTGNKSWQGQPLSKKEPKSNWSEVSTWRLSWRLHSTQSSRHMRTAGKQQIKLVSSGVLETFLIHSICNTRGWLPVYARALKTVGFFQSNNEINAIWLLQLWFRYSNVKASTLVWHQRESLMSKAQSRFSKKISS